MSLIRRTTRKLIKVFYDNTRVLVYKKSFSTDVSPSVLNRSEVNISKYDKAGDFMWRETYFKKRERLISERFVRGDNVIILWRGNEIAHVAWVGNRNEIVALDETGPNVVLPLNTPGLVIYDCCTPEDMRGTGYYGIMLDTIERSCNVENLDLWIYCVSNNWPSRNVIEKIKFQRVAELVRKRVVSVTVTEKVLMFDQ